MPYFVYVLRSKKDNKRYTGFTNNLKRRISQHKSGKVFATSKRLPLELEHIEEYQDKIVAINREKYFKRAAGRRFLDKIRAGGGMADTIV